MRKHKTTFGSFFLSFPKPLPDPISAKKYHSKPQAKPGTKCQFLRKSLLPSLKNPNHTFSSCQQNSQAKCHQNASPPKEKAACHQKLYISAAKRSRTCQKNQCQNPAAKDRSQHRFCNSPRSCNQAPDNQLRRLRESFDPESASCSSLTLPLETDQKERSCSKAFSISSHPFTAMPILFLYYT